MKNLRAAVALLGLGFATCSGEVIREPVETAKEPVEAIQAVPIYGEAFYEPEKFRRAHIHILGLEKSSADWFAQLRKPKANFEISTFGSDTGSNEDFPIGQFKTKRPFGFLGGDPYLYDFDYKEVLSYKIAGTTGIKFTVKDASGITEDLLFEVDLSIEELPALGSGYVEYRRKSTAGSSCAFANDAELVFRVKIMDQTDTNVSLEELYAITYNISSSNFTGVEYDEVEVLLSGSTHDYQEGQDRAIIQSWRHTDPAQVQGAVLWILGRGDAFQHSHVAERLLFGPNSTYKFDLYVVNWRLNGLAAMHRGHLTDAYYLAQMAYSDYNVYNEEIQAAMDRMKQGGRTYNKVLGYGHSTGAPMLLNYILENGDDEFDAFLLNSPFLGFGTTCFDELNARYTTAVLRGLCIWDNDSTISQVPTVTSDPPINFLKRDIVMSARRFIRTLLHPHPWSWRPRFEYPSTLGFLKGSADVWTKIERAGSVTEKPSLVFTSKGDLVLDPKELEERSLWISEGRENVRFEYNNHDVFLAYDFDDALAAIETTRQWMGTTLGI